MKCLKLSLHLINKPKNKAIIKLSQAALVYEKNKPIKRIINITIRIIPYFFAIFLFVIKIKIEGIKKANIAPYDV